MLTLEELLAEDGFHRERAKQKLLQRENSAARFHNLRHGFSRSKPFQARTRSDVNPLRSLPIDPEKCGYTEPRFSSTNFYKEQLPELQVRDARVSRCSKEAKDFEGRSGCSEDLLRRLGCTWSCENELYEHEERKGERIQNLFKSSFKDDRVRFPVPTLGEIRMKEVLLKINSCVTDLLGDESFRLSVNQSCVFSLNSSEMKGAQLRINGVFSSLNEAIEAVESIITEGFTKLELNKTFRKLSVITNMMSKESEDAYYCGTSLLSHLIACAHLYLSILYKFQKKDTVSVMHLLQVFFHSPYQARTALLPELWESVFFPHFSHLKQWHDREAESLQGTFGTTRKLKFLKKLYDDHLDMSTSKFASFYKGWLMEDYKNSALTSVITPFAAFPTMLEEDYEILSTKISRSSYTVPSKAMISKIAYESQSERRGKQEAEKSEVLRQYQETMKEDDESIEEYYSVNSWRKGINGDSSSFAASEKGRRSPNTPKESSGLVDEELNQQTTLVRSLEPTKQGGKPRFRLK